MTRAILHSLITSLFVFTLVSCGGGGGSAGIGGTGITSGGTITGFGSIFVNGIEYDTNSATVSGDLVNVNDLKLGMVVTVRGELNDGTTTGTADTIVVDIELKGAITTTPVLDTKTNTKSFTVLGRNVIVSDSETVFDGLSLSFANIALNDVVEVSGYLDASGNLQASRAEKKGTLILGTTEIEVNGTYVQALSPTSFELMVDGNILVINNPRALTVSGGFSNGQRLEVEGIQTTNTEIEATSIELDEDAINDSDDEVEIEGLITNYVSNTNFTVNGQQVNASQATLSPSNLVLTDNVKVEVEGNLVNGVLVAEKVEARSGEIEIKANVSSANGVDVINKTITLTVNGQDITFSTNNLTTLEDDDQEIEPFTLADINDGDYLSIKAYDDNGTYIATDVKRKEDALDAEIKIEGMVTAIDLSTPGQEGVTILGIPFATDAMTSFEIDDEDKTRSEFFSALNVGDTVEVEDQKSNGMLDGIADEMDLNI
jgi:hypothetical protein